MGWLFGIICIYLEDKADLLSFGHPLNLFNERDRPKKQLLNKQYFAIIDFYLILVKTFFINNFGSVNYNWSRQKRLGRNPSLAKQVHG